jgi:16S rRNA processing protein RimM
VRVIVGRIGRAHGIRGEVGIEVRTDEPERRFCDGAQLVTDTSPERMLTIAGFRWHGDRLLVKFAEVPDRTAAEQLRNTVVQVDVPDDERPEHPDEYYDRDLVGLTVRTADGSEAGEVTAVVHLPAQDLLEVARSDGQHVLVPLVADLVPSIALDEGYLVVADRPGLLDPQAAETAETEAPTAEVAEAADARTAASRTADGHDAGGAATDAHDAAAAVDAQGAEATGIAARAPDAVRGGGAR